MRDPFAAFFLLLAVPAAHPVLPDAAQSKPIVVVPMTPREAIFEAAAASPDDVAGYFAITVRGGGMDDGMGFLNSRVDYRDPRNLSIQLSPGSLHALRERLGAEPWDAWRGQRVVARGTARTVRIAFFCRGEMTDKYYYQTHVVLDEDTPIVVTAP